MIERQRLSGDRVRTNRARACARCINSWLEQSSSPIDQQEHTSNRVSLNRTTHGQSLQRRNAVATFDLTIAFSNRANRSLREVC